MNNSTVPAGTRTGSPAATRAFSIRNLRIGTRLGLSFGAVLLLLLLALGVGLKGLLTMYDEADRSMQVDVALAASGAEVAYQVTLGRVAFRDMMLSLEDPAAVARHKESFVNANQQFQAEIAKLRGLPLEPELQKQIEQIAQEQAAYLQAMNGLIAEFGRSIGNSQVAMQKMEPYRAQTVVMVTHATELRALGAKHVAALPGQLAGTRDKSRTWLLAIGGVSQALGILLCVLITRSITRPVRRAADVARAITNGRFDNAMEVGARDETGELLASLATMQEQLLENELDAKGQLAMIDQLQAVAEFSTDGVVTRANENFARAFGYRAEELKGKPHELFVRAEDRHGSDYSNFKAGLARGEAQIGQFRRVAQDGSEVWVQSVYAPIKGASGKPFKVVEFATDITQQRQQAALNAAFKGALQRLSAVVMVADNDGRIIYLNDAGSQLMKTAAADFRKEIPTFDPARVVGSNIDQVHHNAGPVRNMMASLTDTHSTETRVGARTMRLVINPMKDDTGTRLGTVVEWTDRTQELNTEAEVQQVVNAVSEGDLSLRIALEGKTGFFGALAGSLNNLVEAVAISVAEQARLVRAANDGDLTARVETEGKSGLIVKIGDGLNQLVENMSGIVSQVKSAAGEVTRGAEEISQGNANLSQRTEEQASSLEETASSMEEMTSTVRQNAENAGHANQLAAAARDQAEKGGAVVTRAVAAMGEINGASRKIADIIGVIDEIAFQTNLLALNAAVEAARAGEQGRGFAVVATEVRNLAGRSATAAREIKSLIQDSVQKVEEGSNLVTQSGATLEQIIAAVKKVTDIVAEISAASNEQSAGIDQVNKAVMQLDELTQQNAALVEQASAASQSMAEQARGLNDVMGRYRVDAPTGIAPSTRASRTAVQAVSQPQRRKATRPWAGAATAAARPVAATGTDVAWKEF